MKCQVNLWLLPLLSATIVSAATSYAAWAADTAIRRKYANGLNSAGTAAVIYDHGTFWEGLKQLYADTGNVSYYNWLLDGASRLVDSNGKIISSYE